MIRPSTLTHTPASRTAANLPGADIVTRTRRQAWATFVCSTILTCSLPSEATAGEPVRLSWWSNQTASSCMWQGVDTLPESVRLNNCLTGFSEGTVSLPAIDDWTLLFYVKADGEPLVDPTDYVDVFIDGSLIGRYMNDPPGTFHLVDVQVTGDTFDYRFDFSSSNDAPYLHMSVIEGTAARFTPLRWWSSLSDSDCATLSPTYNDPERVRHGNCTSAFGEGTISLPAADTWELVFFVRQDADAEADPNDFVDVFINAVDLGRFYNDPPGYTEIRHTITGDTFDYRFEFTSSNITDWLHMSVETGSAKPVSAVPTTSDWGLVVMGLLIASTGTLVYRNRLSATAT